MPTTGAQTATTASVSVTTANTNYINCDKAVKLISLFDGTPSKLHHFIDSVDFIFTKFDPTELLIFPFIVKSRLEGKALDFIGSREFSTWQEIKDALLTQFGENLDLQCLNFELCHFKQRFNEKSIVFIERIEKQLIRINKVIKYDSNLSITDKTCLNNFHNKTGVLTAITGLKEPLCQMLRALNPVSLVQIKQILNDYENQQFFKQTNSNFSKLNIKDENKPSDTAGAQRSLHGPSNPISTNQTNPPIKLTIPKCTICYKYGHKAEKCFRKNETQNIVHNTCCENNNSQRHEEEIELEIDEDFLKQTPSQTLEFSN